MTVYRLTEAQFAAQRARGLAGSGGMAVVGVANAQDRPVARDRAAAGTGIAVPERDILRACLLAARLHPLCAWANRVNSGAYKTEAGHFLRFGFVGCSDIIGQLRDGRILCIEVKRDDAKPTPAQQQFLFTVARFGGCAFVARDVQDVIRGIR